MEQDIKMNSFASASDAKYVYAETLDGSQVRIKKSDLLSALFQDRGVIPNGNDLNNYHYGIFRVYPENGVVLNGPNFGRYILICFNSSGHIAQFAVNVHPGQYNFMYRASHDYGGTWNSWKSISIT